MSYTNSAPQVAEFDYSQHKNLLCWKSIFAGVLISIMSYMTLAALGAGIVGSAAQSAIENESNGSALATGSGLWLGLAAVISLFLGSYFAVRVAKSAANKVGAAHGFVIASIFFILLMIEASAGLGALSRGFGHLVEGIGKGSASISASPMVQDTVNKALESANLKTDPRVVAEGLAIRLMQGNMDSAKSYFAYQTGISGAELDAKISQLKSDFDHAAKIAGEKIARVVADTGWSLFVTFMVGLLSALIGGRVAAHTNSNHPLAAKSPTVYHAAVLANESGSALPYVLGWLLGVPTSILLLIFVLRSAF